MPFEKIASASKRKTRPIKGIPKLYDLCINSVVTHLERYPANVFGIVNEYEWESILKLRYRKTKPLKGKGGIDGNGRFHPAVTDKFMLEVEEQNPHLQQSKCADLYVWKDCVNYKFKTGGVSRPKGLLYPYPFLVGLLEEGILALNDCLNEGDNKKVMASALNAIETISESPMDLNLLKSSGIGKKVRKFLVKSTKIDFLDEPYVYSSGKDIRKTPRTTLEATLQSWKDIAAECGVKMKPGEKNDSTTKVSPATSYLSTAKKCHSWRTLYLTLKVHDEDRRSRQGEKMRERRRRLDTVRPKIVKVSSASYKQDKILNRQSFGSGFSQSRTNTSTASSGSDKIRQLRMEAKVTSTRRQPPQPSPAATKARSGFGAAVAFAAVSKTVTRTRKTGLPAVKTIALAGGKRINIPDAKGASGNVRKRLKMLKKGNLSFRR